MSEEKLDRLDVLAAAFDQAEEGVLEAPIEKEIEVVEPDPIIESKEEPVEFSKDETVEEEKPAMSRPSTWKKEYLPIWDKLTTGQQLSNDEAIKLAEYSNQRESEYKKGVSTYKAEADRAKPLIEAIAPYEADLQKRGINPNTYINNLIRAEQLLTNSSMEQRVQIFQRLASDYGINLNNNGQVTQHDPYTQQLMNQLNQVNQEVSSIKGRFAQEENQRLTGEIERVRSDVEHFPHFDAVREEMAQLLELGKAPDLETAYKKAVRMNDDVWALEQDRLLKDAKQQAVKAQQVQKAKAAAVSPRSTTPSGQVNSGDKKDRRSLLAEQINADNGGRV